MNFNRFDPTKRGFLKTGLEFAIGSLGVAGGLSIYEARKHENDHHFIYTPKRTVSKEIPENTQTLVLPEGCIVADSRNKGDTGFATSEIRVSVPTASFYNMRMYISPYDDSLNPFNTEADIGFAVSNNNNPASTMFGKPAIYREGYTYIYLEATDDFMGFLVQNPNPIITQVNFRKDCYESNDSETRHRWNTASIAIA